MVYSKNSDGFELNKLSRSDKQLKNYKNPDNDPRGQWTSGGVDVGPVVEEQVYEIITPSGRKVWPPKGYCWRYKKEKFFELVNDNRIWFGENGNNVPRIKRFLTEVKEGVTAMTLWLRDEVGDNQEAKREIKEFNSDDVFTTPKPERLMQRIITLASNEDDWVLDSFLGSGTTAAVAQKMKRKWIGIELGEHCHTHCIPRLQKVIDGKDKGGITEAVNWEGGGGFKYYFLAPSLLKKDKYGNWVIDENYNAEMLAAAMSKQEAFHYQPDSEIYWKQGQSTEKDYIYTTTQFITVAMLDKIQDEMKADESLLICCKSFSVACEDRYPNITVKKIPQMLLGRCEFGKEDYSLNIINLPVEEQEEETEETVAEEKPGKKKSGKLSKAKSASGGKTSNATNGKMKNLKQLNIFTSR